MSSSKSRKELVEATNASTHTRPPTNNGLGEDSPAQGSSPLPHQLNLSSPSFVRSDGHEPSDLPPSSPSADFRWRLSRRDRSSTPSDPDMDPFPDNAPYSELDETSDADGDDEDENEDHEIDPKCSAPIGEVNEATWLDGSGGYRRPYAEEDESADGYNDHEASDGDRDQGASRSRPHGRMGDFEHVNGYANDFTSSPPHHPDVRSPRPPMGRVRTFAAIEQAQHERNYREREEADMEYQLHQNRTHYGEDPQPYRSNYRSPSVQDNNMDDDDGYHLDDDSPSIRKGGQLDCPKEAVNRERSSSPRSRDHERQQNRHRPDGFPYASHYRSREATPPPSQDTQRHGLSRSSPHTPSSASTLTITLKDNMTHAMEVRVKTTTPMEKVMAAWKVRHRVQGNLRFLFDGERVTEDATCDSMGMVDRYVVEVFAEQLGGR